jgi:hypothetical protein
MRPARNRQKRHRESFLRIGSLFFVSPGTGRKDIGSLFFVFGLRPAGVDGSLFAVFEPVQDERPS